MRWSIAVVSLLCVSSSFAQTFQLVEPSGEVAATIQLERNRLIIHQPPGSRQTFHREQRYDSPDGLFLGYFHFEQKSVLRFPRSGQGRMQVASLNDASPRFRYTRRTVRRWIGGNDYGGPVLERPPAFGPLYQWTPDARFTPPGDYSIWPLDDRYSNRFRYPQSVLIDSRIVPNPPLAPARVQLHNGGPREIQVGVIDLKNRSGTRSVRIRPGEATEVELERDSGAKQINVFRTITPLGDFVSKEIIRPIPPAIRYEVVVHQWAMQSIAIDRTGKSPSQIEDVNFQGKGLGRFPLPPGDLLRSGPIDVFRTAIESGNQGTVAPILAPEKRPVGGSPLERAVFEAQQRALQRQSRSP